MKHTNISMTHTNGFSRAAGVAILAIGATGVLATSTAAQATWSADKLNTLTDEQVAILSYLTLEMVDDGTGNMVPTVQLNGANFRIVNGLGSTQTSNSSGNLIVGYNELGNVFGDDRTGSHNIAFGEANSFSSFGGLVGPNQNTISSAFASVSDGQFNVASGSLSSISGGYLGSASAFASSVSGGASNTASAAMASVSGGYGNKAKGDASSISGGQTNTANALWSSVSGGQLNKASGALSSVSGGRNRSALGAYDWAAGSLWEDQ